MENNKKTAKTPRPLNCFLIYRNEKQKEILKKCPGASHRDLSKIIAKWWKETSEEEKEPFRVKSRIAKEEHARMYPDYKYKPKKSDTPKRAYVRKGQHKIFTSRSSEKNRFMESIYGHGLAKSDCEKKVKKMQPSLQTNDSLLYSDPILSNPSPQFFSPSLSTPWDAYLDCFTPLLDFDVLSANSGNSPVLSFHSESEQNFFTFPDYPSTLDPIDRIIQTAANNSLYLYPDQYYDDPISIFMNN